MRPVVTVTVNPTIDAFCRADRLMPVRKVRTRDERYVPGGGGLNVSRVVHELGGTTVAFYVAGQLPGPVQPVVGAIATAASVVLVRRMGVGTRQPEPAPVG